MLGTRRGGLRLRPGPRFGGVVRRGRGRRRGRRRRCGLRRERGGGRHGHRRSRLGGRLRRAEQEIRAGGEAAVVEQQMNLEGRHCHVEAGHPLRLRRRGGLVDHRERAPVRQGHLRARRRRNLRAQHLEPEHLRAGVVAGRVGRYGGDIDVRGDRVRGDLAPEQRHGRQVCPRLARGAGGPLRGRLRGGHRHADDRAVGGVRVRRPRRRMPGRRGHRGDHGGRRAVRRDDRDDGSLRGRRGENAIARRRRTGGNGDKQRGECGQGQAETKATHRAIIGHDRRNRWPISLATARRSVSRPRSSANRTTGGACSPAAPWRSAPPPRRPRRPPRP